MSTWSVHGSFEDALAEEGPRDSVVGTMTGRGPSRFSTAVQHDGRYRAYRIVHRAMHPHRSVSQVLRKTTDYYSGLLLTSYGSRDGGACGV